MTSDDGWSVCSAPSTERVLRPVTQAVENRGASTVKPRLPRSMATASSYPVTSQPSSAGMQETGFLARSRARTP